MILSVVLRTQPDGKLLGLAAAGSEGAFEAIVHRYRRLLLGYCRRLLLSESRSEDVVQQALLAAWSALRNGTEVRELKGWLYRIVHNEAMTMLRRPGYQFAELPESMTGTGAPEVDLERRMLVRETLVAVAALPELQRRALVLTALDGRSYGEVAAALGLTDHAVRGLVYRARLSLRAGVAAVAPGPLVVWAAGQARRSGAVAQRGETLARGAAAGGCAARRYGST